MGNEHSAFCSDSAGCCGRSSSQRSQNLTDIVISRESRPTSRTSPLVEFDKSAWLREPQEPNNKPQDESPDRLGDLKAARADRRRAYAVPVHPVAALTLRQFALSPLLYLQPKWRKCAGAKTVRCDPAKISYGKNSYRTRWIFSKRSCEYFEWIEGSARGIC